MLEMIKNKNTTLSYPIYNIDRLSIWQKSKGLLKKRIKDPILELRKMRKEWDRKLA